MKVERSRVIQRLRSLYFECGIRVKTARATPERVPLARLRAPGARSVARAYLRQLETLTELTREAREALLSLAQQSTDFGLLQTIPYVGEIRAAELLAIAESPHRFRSVRAFWAYGGLGVLQKISSEHRIENGRPIREDRARGIKLRVGQPILKRVLRDVALHASIGRGHFRTVFEAHVARGKAPAIARIALARKIAAIILAVWRSGTPYSGAVAISKSKSRGEHPA
jgi:transposase